MKFTMTSEIRASRDRVFAALIDPDVLRQCIPGCETLVTASADVYEATITIGVAGLKGTYIGKARIGDKEPPESFTIRFDGKGGPGFVRGLAAIRLGARDGSTHVTCEADLQVGGLIAAVGSRLIEATGRKITTDFFRQLSAVVSYGHPD